MSGTGGVSEHGRLPGTSSRPASWGPAGSTQIPPAGGVRVVDISTPLRRPSPTGPSGTPLLNPTMGSSS
eukprot:5921917-Alexandrium_andersonii.AAC.1